MSDGDITISYNKVNKCYEISATLDPDNETQYMVDEMPTDRAVICVVNNGPFEADAFAYDKDEMDAFNDPQDGRPKRWLVMDLNTAKKLTGFSR